MTNKNVITVRQIRSGSGRKKNQIATLRGLGLGKLRRESRLDDTPAVQGMISKVKHLIEIVHNV
ncbi:Ribosomal protein L30 [Candidatus Endolissoclinum faulkneri L2]|uniref:Large ribosomal subunit protein uL30 n=1 Tax=Candidatus Endolissoclinum faulkneri L2 TaxID=1193729 RepID=K7YFS3_9PROT|nr:50S ribosomal protein L30 [Candidatus Endolissoclinum faulkneri]AFX98420.1 Ribosomal protein L30 [Candidatus Endolissoclinum faulkneri L2]